MFEHDEDLKELCRIQKEEITNLKMQLENAIKTRSFNKDILIDMERTQSELNKTLQDQLNKTLRTKADLQGQELDDVINDDSSSTELEKANALIKKIKFELQMEKGQTNILKHDLKMLKQLTVELHASAEQEEEFISNRLLKRISGLKKEKGDLLQMVEQEEEFLTNSLQKRIANLQKEKVDLENALEQEQEFVVNKLQKQLDSLRLQYGSSPHSHSPSPTLHPSQRDQITSSPPLLPTAVISSSPPSAGLWRPTHSASASDYGGASPGIVEMLKAEVNSLRLKLGELDREVLSANNQTRHYRHELNELRKAYNLPIPDENIISQSDSSVRSHRSISNASSTSQHAIPIVAGHHSRHTGRSQSVSGEVSILQNATLPPNP